MDRKKKNRIIIFLIFPVILAGIVFPDDIIIKIVAGLLLFIYIGLLVFLRDSFVSRKEPEDYPEYEPKEPPRNLDYEEGFKIIKKNTKEVLDEDDFSSGLKPIQEYDNPEQIKSKYSEIVNEPYPKGITEGEQFSFILERLLGLIKESYQAHSAILFWYHAKEEKISIENSISDSQSEVISYKLDLSDDIISQIIKNAAPSYLTEIPVTAEYDIIRYYKTLVGIRSVIGVPVFYEKKIIGVLIIDSKAKDHFGKETIYLLGKFVRFLTIQIGLFEDRYKESLAQKRLSALLSIINSISTFDSIEKVINSISHSVENLIKWDVFALVMFESESKKFKIIKVFNKTALQFIPEDTYVDYGVTLVGKSVQQNTPVKIDDTSVIEIKRFTQNEEIRFDGSFLSIPLVFNRKVFGAFTFSDLKNKAFTNSDLDFLKNCAAIYSFILYSFSMQEYLSELISIDVETQILNRHAYLQRLEDTLVLAKEINIPGALAIIKIDNFLEQESLFESNPLPKVVRLLTDTVKPEMNNFTIFGRLEEKLFGVHFLNIDLQNVFLWAEKIRKRIARQSLMVDGKMMSFTISIGITSSSGIITAEQLIDEAMLAVKKAVEDGGNKVRKI